MIGLQWYSTAPSARVDATGDNEPVKICAASRRQGLDRLSTIEDHARGVSRFGGTVAGCIGCMVSEAWRWSDGLDTHAVALHRSEIAVLSWRNMDSCCPFCGLRSLYLA